MMKNKLQVLRMILIVLFIIPTVQAETIEINSPVADAYIRSGLYATSNYGTAGYMLVKNGDVSAGYARKGYMKFSTSLITETVTDASLTLTVASTPSADFTLEVYGLLDGTSGEDWVEGGIVWNNAPGNNTGSSTAFTSSAVYLGSVLLPSGTPTGSTIDFSTSELIALLNNDTNNMVTIMLGSGNSDAVDGYFATKENSTLAAAKLTVTQVPEPATAGFLAMGAIVSLIRHRKRKI